MAACWNRCSSRNAPFEVERHPIKDCTTRLWFGLQWSWPCCSPAHRASGEPQRRPRPEAQHESPPDSLAVLLIVSGIALADDGDAPKDQPAKFKITTKRKDDSVEVRSDKDQTVFAVKSPYGISQAVIEREDDKWPEAVVLRLHLKGLSNFRASNGKVRVDAAVSIEEGKAKVRMWKDGKEDSPLDEKSPLWTDIRIVGGDGKPAKELPLKDGYFEMALPRAFFEGNPKSITLDWIDFYRE
jgi:hypothetical protein